MRRRALAALTASAAIAGGTLAALNTGAPGITVPLVGIPPAAAAADELRAFDSCEQLRQWYVDATLPDVGPWGLGYPSILYQGAIEQDRFDRDLAATAGISDMSKAVGNSATGTNVQEAGVDEPDVAKTNGRVVVHIKGRYLIIDDVTGEQPHQLSRVRLAKHLDNAELLLVEDLVIVFGNAMTRWSGPVPIDTLGGPMVTRGFVGPVPQGSSSTRIVTIDISDPTDPRVQRDEQVDGGLVSAREYAGTVRAVITSGYPPFDFVYPNRDRTRAEARRDNRQIVRKATIDRWLPGSRVDGAAKTPLVECTDVRHPRGQSGFGTISVLTFVPDEPAGRPSAPTATAITAAGDLVYSSTDRLYVATTTGGWWSGPLPMTGRQSRPRAPHTEVHAFALEGTTTRYVASGEVPGTLRDRWSLSEYDGRLRVATALGRNSWSPRENAVVVLDENGSRLEEVGRVGGLGVREQIESVRWLGDLAIVVTFRQTDPLYTLDLSAPRHPRVIGALKIRGFSSYLHPVGDDLLLGLGQDADGGGSSLGAQAATFDLRQLKDPRRIDTVGFGRNTELTVRSDPRAFSYLPDRNAGLAAVTNWNNGLTRLVSFKVGEDGSLAKTPRRMLGGWRHSVVRILPLHGAKVAVVSGGVVQIVDLS